MLRAFRHHKREAWQQADTAIVAASGNLTMNTTNRKQQEQMQKGVSLLILKTLLQQCTSFNKYMPHKFTQSVSPTWDQLFKHLSLWDEFSFKQPQCIVSPTTSPRTCAQSSGDICWEERTYSHQMSSSFCTQTVAWTHGHTGIYKHKLNK